MFCIPSISKKDNPEGFNFIRMLQETGHPIEIPDKLPAISTGCRGTVLFVKIIWIIYV